MYNGDNNNATIGWPEDGTKVQNPVERKLTLTIDCCELLTPDINKPGNFTSKPTVDAVSYFQLDAIVGIPFIHEIKIRCFHVCGSIEVDEDVCLVGLWNIGDWFTDLYRAADKPVEYKKWMNSRTGDWADADAVLTVFIGERSKNASGHTIVN